jgi:hypothetical protein
MTIADVMSRVATIGQLTAQSTAPAIPSATIPAAATGTFGDALAAATSTATAEPSAGELGQLAMEAALTGSAIPATASSQVGLDPLALLLGAGGLPTTVAASPTPAAGSSGARVLAAAESQVGVSELPPGSNDGPQLAVYRGAVDGAQAGEPWCAYFASWAAGQGGQPLGDRGQGLGSVGQIADWAQASGRLLPASATPAPGDLILFGDSHVGVVESVNPDGSLTTVEGNYANAVSRVTRSPAEATGYVQL